MRCELRVPLRRKCRDDHVFINLKRHAITIAINTFTVYTFDLLGRLKTAVRDQHTFRRGFDNRFLEKWSIGNATGRSRVRSWLDDSSSKSLVDTMIQDVAALRDVVERDKLAKCNDPDLPGEPDAKVVLDALTKVLSYDFQGLQADAEVFRSIYRPVGILPPDLYLALVLQATEGCSYNRCSFCDFYKTQSFRVKSPSDFRRHTQSVLSWFGPALALRKSVFLGEANALDLPMSKLLPLLQIASTEFAKALETTNHALCLQDFYGFMSGFGSRKSVADFEELRACGIRRVYIGLESGSPDLLRFLNKPIDTTGVLDLVTGCRRAGIAVGIIVLLGVGGARFHSRHVEDTVALVREMELGAGDMLYFSPTIERPRADYFNKTKGKDTMPLTAARVLHQKHEMLSGMMITTGGSGPKVATYDIEEFIF